MTSDSSPVWLVTGASSGIGREIAMAALRRGWRVAMAARNPDPFKELIRGFEDRALALAIDVGVPKQVSDGVRYAQEHFGRIDVLVNSAGQGYLCAIEEGDDRFIRDLFEVNYFGVVNAIKAVLPGMRQRRSGYIVNISSVGGLEGNLGHGYYASTKFAIEGLSDALHKEVEPLGLRVLVVEPGPTRSNFFSRDSIRVAEHSLDDYAATVGARTARQLQRPGSADPGDPSRIASLILKVMDAKRPPLRLVLGNVGIDVARRRMSALSSDIDEWEEDSRAIDFVDRV